MDLPRVPIYVSPTRVVLTTVACAAGCVALFYGAGVLAFELTERVLYDRPPFASKEKP